MAGEEDSDANLKRSVEEVGEGSRKKSKLAGDEDSGANSGDDDVMVEELGGDEKPKYKILTEEIVREIQEKDMLLVSKSVSISKGIACSLLLKENWCPTSAIQKWDPNQHPQLMQEKNNHCKLCMMDVEMDRMLSVGCGHSFCEDCWKYYVCNSIKKGKCLSLSCPGISCKAVALDMVDSLASADEKKTFLRFLFRFYVDCSPHRKWCPAPGCGRAVEFVPSGEHGISYDVRCDCWHRFCWKCGKECHRPVECETALAWLEMISSVDDASERWLKENTRACPGCERAIERYDVGCSLMRCPCGVNFCWWCLEAMEAPHDQLFCKGYRPGTEQQHKSSSASEELTRWASNIYSMDTAVDCLNRARTQVKAWDQIVEFWQVLKWTDVYEYYAVMPEKKDMIQKLRDEAESAEEELRGYAERELKDGNNEELERLTSAAQLCIHHLLKAIDKDNHPTTTSQ